MHKWVFRILQAHIQKNILCAIRLAGFTTNITKNILMAIFEVLLLVFAKNNMVTSFFYITSISWIWEFYDPFKLIRALLQMRLEQAGS